MFRRLIASFLCFTFSFSNFQYVQAQGFIINQLPVPGTMVGESASFAPAALKGVIVNPQKPLEFQFIVDTGKGPQDIAFIKEEANQLVKYFLAGLTIPEGDVWVNLSPYEKNRMVPEVLGQTDLGRDLLAQDYILKQLTASFIYPDKDLGKEFWSRVYAKAQQQFGTTNVPVNTFNKVWILPDQAQVYENGGAAYVTQSTLKVMLDEDYTALQKHMPVHNSTDSIGSQIIRQIILPEIKKEVNTGKNFAPLRQIYQALILAKWYKETIQNSLLDAIYTNKKKIAGVNLNDPTVKEQIYERYLKAYKKGAFNFIKEDPMPGGQVVPRKYFSGGIPMVIPVQKTHSRAMLNAARKLIAGSLILMTLGLSPVANKSSAYTLPRTPYAQIQPPNAAMTVHGIEFVAGISLGLREKLTELNRQKGLSPTAGIKELEEALIGEVFDKSKIQIKHDKMFDRILGLTVRDELRRRGGTDLRSLARRVGNNYGIRIKVDDFYYKFTGFCLGDELPNIYELSVNLGEAIAGRIIIRDSHGNIDFNSLDRWLKANINGLLTLRPGSDWKGMVQKLIHFEKQGGEVATEGAYALLNENFQDAAMVIRLAMAGEDFKFGGIYNSVGYNTNFFFSSQFSDRPELLVRLAADVLNAHWANRLEQISRPGKIDNPQSYLAREVVLQIYDLNEEIEAAIRQRVSEIHLDGLPDNAKNIVFENLSDQPKTVDIADWELTSLYRKVSILLSQDQHDPKSDAHFMTDEERAGLQQFKGAVDIKLGRSDNNRDLVNALKAWYVERGALKYNEKTTYFELTKFNTLHPYNRRTNYERRKPSIVSFPMYVRRLMVRIVNGQGHFETIKEIEGILNPFVTKAQADPTTGRVNQTLINDIKTEIGTAQVDTITPDEVDKAVELLAPFILKELKKRDAQSVAQKRRLDQVFMKKSDEFMYAILTKYGNDKINGDGDIIQIMDRDNLDLEARKATPLTTLTEACTYIRKNKLKVTGFNLRIDGTWRISFGSGAASDSLKELEQRPQWLQKLIDDVNARSIPYERKKIQAKVEPIVKQINIVLFSAVQNFPDGVLKTQASELFDVRRDAIDKTPEKLAEYAMEKRNSNSTGLALPFKKFRENTLDLPVATRIQLIGLHHSLGYFLPEFDPDKALGRVSAFLGPRDSLAPATNPGASGKDSAMVKSVIDNGGIALNQINVKRNGKTINIQFDQAQLSAFIREGFAGFTFKIENMTTISIPSLSQILQ